MMRLLAFFGTLLFVCALAFAGSPAESVYLGAVAPGSSGLSQFDTAALNDLLSQTDSFGEHSGRSTDANRFSRCGCTVECPAGARPEGEPCLNLCDHYNGGCFSTPPAFMPIACNDVICGSAFSWFLIRDTDWYELTVSERDTVTFTVTAEFDVLAMILGPGANGCEDRVAYTAPAVAQECHPLTVSAVLDRGTYWLYVAPAHFQWMGCRTYVASVNCSPADNQLAAELRSFDAVPEADGVTVRWQTVAENRNDHFEIERDGQTVARVNATNSASGARYSWTDQSVQTGESYTYTLVAVDVLGNRTVLGSRDATATAGNPAEITDYALYQNFPNPFNPTTSLSFDLAERGFVTLKLYNMVGQEIATMVNRTMDQGHHVVHFDGTNLPSAMYLYTLQANGYTATKKMLLLK
ncbi:MAG TPA: T9SS type A sorting domain-containing protein [bacterium]